MCRYPGSFRADGAYGQFGVVFPDLDLIVILTTATEQTQEELSALQEELIPYVKKEAGELPPSPLAGAVKSVPQIWLCRRAEEREIRLWKRR